MWIRQEFGLVHIKPSAKVTEFIGQWMERRMNDGNAEPNDK